MIQSPHSKLPLLLPSVDSWSIFPEWTLYSFTFQICLIIVCVSLIVCYTLLKRNFSAVGLKVVLFHLTEKNSVTAILLLTQKEEKKTDFTKESSQRERERGHWGQQKAGDGKRGLKNSIQKQGRRVCFYHKKSSQSQRGNTGFEPPKVIHVACTLNQFYWRDANRKKKKIIFCTLLSFKELNVASVFPAPLDDSSGILWDVWLLVGSTNGEGNGNPLQYFCLENPRGGRAWWAAVYGVAQSQTRLKWLQAAAGSTKS